MSTTTYLSNNAVKQAIDQLQPHHPGRNTSILGVWNSILTTQFPTWQGYITSPREHGWFNERDLWYDLQVQHVRNNSSNLFLVVICRTASDHASANANEGLDQWTVHLELYLDTIFGKRRRHGRPVRVYGVIAHGLEATFFTYDVGDDLPMLICREHDMDGKPAYHLVNDHQMIQTLLDAIRVRH
ncbi:hypothetical protein PMG11_09541 [Penicillium brasilianum]|uniref:Uncharacterized protein n=1 Tax=Penicillium brasilianum TaxID=104259 RepID=A0A0F7TWI1_PENBI|nr:hypothetical protein PMG11_09541 [Penicillium brasilianum]